ncbi:MAG TPA: 2,3-epoxybenzoyl-CoA dihydrolase [Candidatus Binataceae bacterium]|nr:2,3-epoxybenzoyl-CoA dihydrolase [Candidatus Binataceae bacterium]
MPIRSPASPLVDFRTEPSKYRHWKLSIAGPVATLALDVDEAGGLFPGYELKLNSYDLGVDIELYDAVQRLRFEHPEVGCVVITSARERVFSAGANIRMLAQSSHPFKVNFCKYTNETRIAIEDATSHSRQSYITSIAGACAGGGYELALATDYIIMADDGSTSVSLPELPLLGVLPGTGGLTRLVDKRMVRRDHADFLCTTEEGVKGARAAAWRLVDEVAPRSQLAEVTARKAAAIAARSDRGAGQPGLELRPLARTIEDSRILYPHMSVELDRARSAAYFTINGPADVAPASVDQLQALGCDFWPLAFARELEDAILHLRFNENTIGTWIFRTRGDLSRVKSHDDFLAAHTGDWLAREIVLYLKRTLKRLDVSSRSIFALIEPGSCFCGSLLELALAADRAYMMLGARAGDDFAPARIALTELNFGALPMCNGLMRIQARHPDPSQQIAALRAHIGTELPAERAETLGLVGFTPDDFDWDDETRLAIEERAAFSSDALTGLEASLRFTGPETIESKIFARLSAWQNWIFQRPNATGEKGALKLYGTGRRPEFDPRRV